VQAGDLSSHLYNAWLAGFIEQGKASGLVVVPQTTNVLFDLMLSRLLPLGLEAAQRIPVALAVLTLVWGAFAFLRVATGRAAFEVFPAIAMLAYGWTFHMGLFNFYIGLGLSFWAMALVWEWRPPRSWIAVPLLALAYTAHGLPVAWAVAVLAYRHLSIRPKLALALLVAGAFVLRFVVPSRWFGDQIESALGIDQLAVYGSKFWVPALCLLLYWVWLAIERSKREGSERVFSGTLFEVSLLTAAGIVIIPNWILLPGYHHALVFLAQRMSLPLGICLCGWTACAAPPRMASVAMAVSCLLFFGFLYVDEGALNRVEDQMAAAVAQLPPWQRVVNGIDVADSRTNPVTHMLDRVCLSRCFSYGNYEASSAQFRVRATAPNPFEVITDADANNLQNGSYIVKERDLPLYQLTLDAAGDVALRQLAAGQRTGIVFWKGL
jgi:hypothetical protein